MTPWPLHSAPSITRSAPYCDCGAKLPPRPATGRPRLTCSEKCRRARDHRQRKIQRRLQWIETWKAELGKGRFTRDQIRAEVRALQAEVRALRRPVPAHADDHAVVA